MERGTDGVGDAITNGTRHGQTGKINIREPDTWRTSETIVVLDGKHTAT